MTTIRRETYEGKRQTASRMADGLCLAAAPIFAVMALATAGDGDMLCTMPGISALSGMSLMYLLMSVFHAVPWLKRRARQSYSSNPAKETA